MFYMATPLCIWVQESSAFLDAGPGTMLKDPQLLTHLIPQLLRAQQRMMVQADNHRSECFF
jgi:hypothetical protein